MATYDVYDLSTLSDKPAISLQALSASEALAEAAYRLDIGPQRYTSGQYTLAYGDLCTEYTRHEPRYIA